MNLVVRAIRHLFKASRVLSDLSLIASRKLMIGVFGHRKFKRFIVLTGSRTGSSMLISFLDGHPKIRAEGEHFRRLEGRNYKDVLAKAFGKSPRHIKAKGFKIFYYHPLDEESRDVWDDLVNMDGLYIIHLKRRNILRTLVSRKIAEIQDAWSSTSSDENTDADKAVTFTEKELEERFEVTRNFEKRGDEMFQDHRLISVYYEDLVSDPQGAFGKITDFLGLRPIQPKTHLKKQNPESLRELVTNFDDLRSAFDNTQWQSFFQE